MAWQAWTSSEGQLELGGRGEGLRSLRVVQVGSRLEKNSKLGKENACSIEQQAIGSGTGNSRTAPNQAYSDSKRALLLYTAYMSALHAGAPSNMSMHMLEYKNTRAAPRRPVFIINRLKVLFVLRAI